MIRRPDPRAAMGYALLLLFGLVVLWLDRRSTLAGATLTLVGLVGLVLWARRYRMAQEAEHQAMQTREQRAEQKAVRQQRQQQERAERQAGQQARERASQQAEAQRARERAEIEHRRQQEEQAREARQHRIQAEAERLQSLDHTALVAELEARYRQHGYTLQPLPVTPDERPGAWATNLQLISPLGDPILLRILPPDRLADVADLRALQSLAQQSNLQQSNLQQSNLQQSNLQESNPQQSNLQQSKATALYLIAFAGATDDALRELASSGPRLLDAYQIALGVPLPPGEPG